MQGIQGVIRGDHSIRQVVDVSASFTSQETISLSSCHFPAGSFRETEEMNADEIKPSRRPYISALDDSNFDSVGVDSSKTGSLVTGNLPDLCMNGTMSVGMYDALLLMSECF